MRKEKRQKEVKLRKNFFVTLLVIIVLWLFVISIIFFVDPSGIGVVPLFLIVSFLALFFTISTVLINTRRGLIISTGLIIFSILRIFGIGNILNLILLIGLVVTLEFYLSKNE